MRFKTNKKPSSLLLVFLFLVRQKSRQDDKGKTLAVAVSYWKTRSEGSRKTALCICAKVPPPTTWSIFAKNLHGYYNGKTVEAPASHDTKIVLRKDLTDWLAGLRFHTNFLATAALD